MSIPAQAQAAERLDQQYPLNDIRAWVADPKTYIINKTAPHELSTPQNIRKVIAKHWLFDSNLNEPGVSEVSSIPIDVREERLYEFNSVCEAIDLLLRKWSRILSHKPRAEPIDEYPWQLEAEKLFMLSHFLLEKLNIMQTYLIEIFSDTTSPAFHSEVDLETGEESDEIIVCASDGDTILSADMAILIEKLIESIDSFEAKIFSNMQVYLKQFDIKLQVKPVWKLTTTNLKYSLLREELIEKMNNAKLFESCAKMSNTIEHFKKWFADVCKVLLEVAKTKPQKLTKTKVDFVKMRIQMATSTKSISSKENPKLSSMKPEIIAGNQVMIGSDHEYTGPSTSAAFKRKFEDMEDILKMTRVLTSSAPIVSTVKRVSTTLLKPEHEPEPAVIKPEITCIQLDTVNPSDVKQEMQKSKSALSIQQSTPVLPLSAADQAIPPRIAFKCEQSVEAKLESISTPHQVSSVPGNPKIISIKRFVPSTSMLPVKSDAAVANFKLTTATSSAVKHDEQTIGANLIAGSQKRILEQEPKWAKIGKVNLSDSATSSRASANNKPIETFVPIAATSKTTAAPQTASTNSQSDIKLSLANYLNSSKPIPLNSANPALRNLVSIAARSMPSTTSSTTTGNVNIRSNDNFTEFCFRGHNGAVNAVIKAKLQFSCHQCGNPPPLNFESYAQLQTHINVIHKNNNS